MDYQKFFIFCQEELDSLSCEFSNSNKNILHLNNAIHSICQKAYDEFAINDVENYYKDFLVYNTIIKITNQFKFLNTPELEYYLNCLPHYCLTNQMNDATIEMHGYFVMKTIQFLNKFYEKEKLNHLEYNSVDSLLSILNEKQMLEEKLKHCLEKDKKQKI